MTRKMIIVILLISSVQSVLGQGISKRVQSTVEEGKLLYRSEMASWIGTDIFFENPKNRESTGGYFSYTTGDSTKCVFFSKGEMPNVIGEITFDNTYQVNNAVVETSTRPFTAEESDLYTIRAKALTEVNIDTIFKTYTNTSLNLVPLITNGAKKVYILTAPKTSGFVIFGNDYILTFDDKNELLEKRILHYNLIPIKYDESDTGEITTIHSHSNDLDDIITPTDICTLMLYEKFAKWERHCVISEKYASVWDCDRDELLIMTRDAWDRLEKNIEK